MINPNAIPYMFKGLLICQVTQHSAVQEKHRANGN